MVDLYRMLVSKMSVPDQQQQQQQPSVIVEPSRPALADMLAINNPSTHCTSSPLHDKDTDLLSSRRHYLPPPSVTKPHCSDGPSTHTDTDGKSTDRPVVTFSKSVPVPDNPRISDASSCNISPTGGGDRSSPLSVSSTNRLQKQPLVTSLHGRAVSQIFPAQPDFGSMMSGLNYSLPQLNNIDHIELCANKDALKRPSDTTSKAAGGQEVRVEDSAESRVQPPPRKTTSNHWRRAEEERKMAEFLALDDSLSTSLDSMEQQLEQIQSNCTSLSSPSDLETLDGISCQFARHEQQLVQLIAASGDVMELTESVEVVKTVQEKVSKITSHVAVTRERLGDIMTQVQANYDKRQNSKAEMTQLMDWLSDASQRLSDCTQRPSVNTVTAELQLGQLLTLTHEFAARKSRLQDLKNYTCLDSNSIVELGHQFDRANDACQASLERHRRLFACLTDIRNSIHQIAVWVAKIGPLYSLDSGSAVGSLEMLDENHAELENRLEEACHLKEKAIGFLAGLRRTEGPMSECQAVEDHEDNLSLMQPLLEVQCQLYQLRELIATRAANMVSDLYVYLFSSLSVCLSVCVLSLSCCLYHCVDSLYNCVYSLAHR